MATRGADALGLRAQIEDYCKFPSSLGTFLSFRLIIKPLRRCILRGYSIIFSPFFYQTAFPQKTTLWYYQQDPIFTADLSWKLLTRNYFHFSPKHMAMIARN